MASGDALLFFTANDAELPAIGGGLSPAVKGTIATTPVPGPQDVLDVLEHGDASEHTGVWSAVMPKAYSGGGINVEIMWVTAATAGLSQWATWFNLLDVGVPLLTNSWFGGQSSVSPAQAVANDIQRVVIGHNDGAQMGNVVAGSFFRFAVRNLAPGPPASIVGDIKFISALLSEI